MLRAEPRAVENFDSVLFQSLSHSSTQTLVKIFRVIVLLLLIVIIIANIYDFNLLWLTLPFRGTSKGALRGAGH